MHVPLTSEELTALLSGARGQTIPLTGSTDTRTDSGFAIDSDATGADWALATLANLRTPDTRTPEVPLAAGVGIGGRPPTGPRQSTGEGNLAGTHTCEKCGEGNFDCGGCGADGYIFPDYGNRLNADQIAALLVRSGRVTSVGAEVIAAVLDAETYVMREPEPRS